MSPGPSQDIGQEPCHQPQGRVGPGCVCELSLCPSFSSAFSTCIYPFSRTRWGSGQREWKNTEDGKGSTEDHPSSPLRKGQCGFNGLHGLEAAVWHNVDRMSPDFFPVSLQLPPDASKTSEDLRPSAAPLPLGPSFVQSHFQAQYRWEAACSSSVVSRGSAQRSSVSHGPWPCTTKDTKTLPFPVVALVNLLWTPTLRIFSFPSWLLEWPSAPL